MVFVLPRQTFSSGALTLFSVNSFLYGFYIAPILSAQKSRIEELHRLARSEANSIFAIMLKVKKLQNGAKSDISSLIRDYTKFAGVNSHIKAEKVYEEIIGYCVAYKGKDPEGVARILEGIVANQQNRTMIAMQLRSSVYNNEWVIMGTLFSITLSFVLLLNAGNGIVFQLLAAFLSTGLTMLIIILIKLSTLTHKRAKQMFHPYHKLIDTNFYRID